MDSQEEQNLQDDSALQDADDDVSIETESNASREDTAAKIEHTLLKKLKMDEQNGDHENGYSEPPPLGKDTSWKILMDYKRALRKLFEIFSWFSKGF